MNIYNKIDNSCVKIIDKCVLKEPVVSICVQTYNHGPYIDQCLASIYAQKTEFDIEILIGDDGSDDGTTTICQEYQRRYPEITRLFIHDRDDNISVLGRASGRFNVLYNLRHARGKFVAFCEGDDYWIDPLKILRQVQHLESHPEHLMCAHNVSIIEDPVSPVIENERKSGRLTFSELASGNFVYTCSIMVRNFEPIVSVVPTYFHDYLLDYYLILYLCNRGIVYFLSDTMSAYRKGVGSFSTRPGQAKSLLSLGTYLLLLDEISNDVNKDILRNAYFTHLKWHLNKNVNLAEEIYDIERCIYQNKYSKEKNLLEEKIQMLEFSLHKSNEFRSNQSEIFRNHVVSAEQRAVDIETSLSYKVGRLLTFPARLVYDIIHVPEERLKIPMTIFRTLTKAPKKFLSYLSISKLFVLFKALANEDPDIIAHNIKAIESGNTTGPLPDERIKVAWPSHIDLAKGREERKNVITPEQSFAPNLDISVVTYNSARWIDGFMKSLNQLNYPLEKINLIFSDNGSTDNTQEMIEGYISVNGSKYRNSTILINDNIGFGRAHNKAFQSADSDYFLVTNIDLEFEQDSFNRLFDEVYNDSDAVFSWELRQKPYEHPKYYDPVTLNTAWSSHACILFNNKYFEELKGYDDNIFMYGEDVELSYRARQKGYKLKYVPKATVWHYTYEEQQFKPLQFLKSTLANGFLRLRYGSWSEVSQVLNMQLSLRNIAVQNGISKGEIYSNIKELLSKTPYYLMKRRKYDARLSFYNWDYEKIREGAFYELQRATVSKPLVSIITRTYKGREYYLNQNLRNVQNQTYPNIEHIVVEDGGHSAAQLVSMYDRHDSTARLSHYGFEKKGRSYTGNKGLSIAKGKYLMFLDDDDLLFPDHVEVLLSAILNSEDNVKAAYSLSWEVLTEAINKEHYKEREIRLPNVFRTKFDRDTLEQHNYIPIQSILFDRELYEQYGGFNIRLDNLEDWNLWFKYSREYDFKYVPKVTSMFRTPYDKEIRKKRQIELDSWYSIAVSENENSYNT